MSANHEIGLIGGSKWAIKASPAISYIFEKQSRNPFIIFIFFIFIFILTLTFFTSSIIYIYRLYKQSEIT
jgi:hypothetical protein